MPRKPDRIALLVVLIVAAIVCWAYHAGVAQTPTPGSCCVAASGGQVTCDDSDCVARVQACDPSCGVDLWDYQCSREAQGFAYVPGFCPAGTPCACVNPVTPTPTPTVTGTPPTETPTSPTTPTFTHTATPTPLPGLCVPLGLCVAWTPTPTATPITCPYTFSTNTGASGRTCYFVGTYNTGCSGVTVPLGATFAGDGHHVTIILSTQPAIIWSGTVATSGKANLTRATVGTLGTINASATAFLQQLPHHPTGFRTLLIDPAGTPPFGLCAFPQGCAGADACDFAAYDGDLVKVISGSAPPPEGYLAPVAR